MILYPYWVFNGSKSRCCRRTSMITGIFLSTRRRQASSICLPMRLAARSLWPTKIYIISGVLKDFNYQSLARGIDPLCLFLSKDTARAWGTSDPGCLFARIQAHTNVPTVVDAIKTMYGKYDQQTALSIGSWMKLLTACIRQRTGWLPYSIYSPVSRSSSPVWDSLPWRPLPLSSGSGR